MPPDTFPSPDHKHSLVYLEPLQGTFLMDANCECGSPLLPSLGELPQFGPNHLAGFKGPLRGGGK